MDITLDQRRRVCRPREASAVAWPPRRAARHEDEWAIRARVSSPSNDGGAQEYRYLHSGRDSDLEAFSRNPPDGSLAPLAYQPST